MRFGLILPTLLAASVVSAAQNENAQAIPVSVRTEIVSEELNIAAVSHALITKEMGENDFQKFVEKVHKRFLTWSQEYDNGNLKQFLDDRLLELAPTVTSGKGKALRDFCQWLALYRVYSEPLPRYIEDISDEDKLWIKTTLANFDWNGAALQIKEHAKR